MTQQNKFEENVKEWIIAINRVVAKLRDEIEEIGICQEEDVITIADQYHIIRQLRREVMQLKKEVNFLKQQEGGIRWKL